MGRSMQKKSALPPYKTAAGQSGRRLRFPAAGLWVWKQALGGLRSGVPAQAACALHALPGGAYTIRLHTALA